MIGLSNRVHIFARPSVQQELAEFFTSVLGCEVSEVSVPGKQMPILLVRFPNGVGMTVELTEDALDEKQALRAAYLELKADDPPGLKQTILEAGLPEVEYAGTPYFYFQAPGGQVFRIVPESD